MHDLLWHLTSAYMKCVYGRAGVRYVITKFSAMDSLPNFLTHGAPLRARFARGSSAINLAWKLKMLNDWYVMQLLQSYLMTCLCKVENWEKFWIHPSKLVCGLGRGVGHVWLWRKPHKCKCDPRLLSMIVVTKYDILRLLTPRGEHTDGQANIP